MQQSLFIQGNQKAVLLLHAFTGVPKDLQLLAKEIARAGYTVYAPLFTGHGTDRVMDLLAVAPTQWQQDAQDAVQWLHEQGYQKVVALGLSLGGVMATDLAAKQQVIAAGAFCAPVTTRSAQLAGLYETFMLYAQTQLKQANLSSAQVEEMLEQIAPKAQAKLKELDQLTRAIAQTVPSITGPFYIAQGAQDTLVDPEASIELKERLVHAWVDFHWFEEVGHIITVSKERLAFQASVVQFLDRIDWG